MSAVDFDVIFAGGGLSTGLMALQLRRQRPDLRVMIIERDAHLGGDHTWSFHGSDLSSQQLAEIKPMIRKRWEAQDVQFPELNRTLTTAYCTIVSEDFHSYLRQQLGSDSISLNTPIESVSSHGVTLSGGQLISANCVFDGRGWQQSTGQKLALAYQKFFGLEVELEQPHGLTRPIIMDATVEQTDGYRFFYCLPYTETSLLIEDTYYSPSMKLDADRAAHGVRAYAERRKWQIAKVVREERGCLPIVLAGEAAAFQVGPEDAVPCGLRAGLFHPTTGYSLPDAVRMADEIASGFPGSTNAVKSQIALKARQLWQERKFYRLLNRLLFVAAEGADKRKVMQRFYRMPQDLIERFYAGRSSTMDKLRVLSGKPPIPVLPAMRTIPAQAAWDFVRAQGISSDR